MVAATSPHDEFLMQAAKSAGSKPQKLKVKK